MRRFMVIVALLGVVAFPVPVLAADPPDPTLAVSSVHYASRGVIELDVTYSCVAPAHSDEWDAYVGVEAEQSRGRRYAYDYIELSRPMCNGQVHVITFRLVPDETAGFKGGRAAIWVDLGVYSWDEETDTDIDQYVSFQRRVHVARH